VASGGHTCDSMCYAAVALLVLTLAWTWKLQLARETMSKPQGNYQHSEGQKTSEGAPCLKHVRTWGGVGCEETAFVRCSSRDREPK